MKRIPLVLMAAMVMGLVAAAMALPAPAAPPQEGDFVGGGHQGCTSDPTTQTTTCIGGGGGHQVGEQWGSGSGENTVRETVDGDLVSSSGGGGSGGAVMEGGGSGSHCVLNSEGTYDCVGSEY